MATLHADVRLNTKQELGYHSSKLTPTVWTDPPEPATTIRTCIVKQRTFFAPTLGIGTWNRVHYTRTQRQVGQHQHSWNNYCLGRESEVDESCLTTSLSSTKMRIHVFSDVTQCFRLSGVICFRGILLGLLDTWKCRYCVRSKLRKPFAEWQCAHPRRPATPASLLTTNMLAQVILCTW